MKRCRINLLIGARQSLQVVQSSKKISMEHGIRIDGVLDPAIEEFKTKLLENPKTIFSVGGNISDGLFVGGGPGVSIGRSKTICGRRKVVVVGQACIINQFGISCAGGYYEHVSRSKRVFTEGVVCASVAVILGGTMRMEPEDGQEPEPPYEVTLDAGAHGMKGILFAGMELISIPIDFKYFRENVGLTRLSARLPEELECQIEAAIAKGDRCRSGV